MVVSVGSRTCCPPSLGVVGGDMVRGNWDSRLLSKFIGVSGAIDSFAVAKDDIE